MDFHHNIFYFYRGIQEDDSAKSRQLEDNTTKALINILKNIAPPITERFLNFIGICIEDNKHIECRLQTNSIGYSVLQRKQQLLLLAIIPKRKDALILNAVNKHHSRPDAWIYGDKFAVLLESKIVGSLDYSQMRAHYHTLAVGSKLVPKYHEITWGEVHHFFNQEMAGLTEDRNPLSLFLLKQFTEYLEMSNLSDFNGFNSEFFDYFFTHDNEESRYWVKKQINEFASVMFKEMSALDKPFYQDFDQGQLKLKDNSSWIAFGPKNKKYRKQSHLSIRFNSQGIEIFINLESKPATDKFKQIIQNHPTLLKQAIRRLCTIGSLTFVLEKREHQVASTYKYYKILELESYALTEKDITGTTYDFLISSVVNTALPSLNIIKKISRTDAIAMSSDNSPEQLIGELIKVTTLFHDFIILCNNPPSLPEKPATPISNRQLPKSLERHFATWRKFNIPINTWGLTWYLANEFAKRFYSSHGIAPRVICHEGVGYYGIQLEQVPCRGHGNTPPLGRLTMFGNVENWGKDLPGGQKLNTIEMCERGMAIEKIVKQSIAYSKIYEKTQDTHLSCRHKQCGDSFLLLFEIATFLAIKYDQETIHIWNHLESALPHIDRPPSTSTPQEPSCTFTFQHKTESIIFADDGRQLSGNQKENYWTRYMGGESVYSLYKDLVEKLGLNELPAS